MASEGRDQSYSKIRTNRSGLKDLPYYWSCSARSELTTIMSSSKIKCSNSYFLLKRVLDFFQSLGRHLDSCFFFKVLSYYFYFVLVNEVSSGTTYIFLKRKKNKNKTKSYSFSAGRHLYGEVLERCAGRRRLTGIARWRIWKMDPSWDHMHH